MAVTRQTNVGQLVLANELVYVNDTTTCWQTVGEKLARIETSSICCQQFANMLLCRSHTPIWVCQHELANISLTCEGRFTVKKHFSKNVIIVELDT